MGYMGLERWGQSDMAADLYGSVVKDLLGALNKGVKEKENCFNTSGPENVAMIIESGLLDSIPEYYIQDHFDYKTLISGLNANIEGSNEDKKKEWDDEESRVMHNEAYKRMLKNVKKFLKKKEIKLE